MPTARDGELPSRADVVQLRDGSTVAISDGTSVYDCLSVYQTRVAVNALRTLDWVARSLAFWRAPFRVGIAIAMRMAMISTTTISSISEKPRSFRSSPGGVVLMH